MLKIDLDLRKRSCATADRSLTVVLEPGAILRFAVQLGPPREERAVTDTGTNEGRIAFLHSLRAVRSFRPDHVPQGVVDDVLEVARWSGSASNRQPWGLVIRDRETLGALARVEGYAHHPGGRPFGPSGHRADQWRASHARGLRRGTPLGADQVLAAWAHGVGSSIGWFVGDGRAVTREILGIPEGRMARTAISLGYPDEEARWRRAGRARKPISEILREERHR